MELKFIDKIKRRIVESGVRRPIKFKPTSSSGEAKFHIGSARDSQEYDDFFNHFNSKNVYKLNKENLESFLLTVKFEYIYHVFHEYKEASLGYWKEKYNELMNFDDEIYFELKKFMDSRYYIFSDDKKFKDYLRSITLPHITVMVISKYYDNKEKKYLYDFNFYLNEEFSNDEQSKVVAENYSEYLTGVNHIIFGAPGTGKSYMLDQLYPNNKRRVTFHPEYTYYDFVGSYKPVPIYKQNSSQDIIDNNGEKFNLGEPLIDYRFVPGPFTLSLLDALKNPTTMYTLIIEELNRANAPAVFGDLFQLLDRDDNGQSIYSVTNLEISNYLKDKVGIDQDPTDYEIMIPNNLNIVATMNSADQGVFVMDSAFKRRWQFEYLPINTQNAEHKDELIPYAKKFITWGSFIEEINKELSSREINITEDKHIGPYFLKPSDLKNKSLDQLMETISSKLLIYLWDDVVRHYRNEFFKSPTTFSKLVQEYKEGKEIFSFSLLLNDEKEEIYDNDIEYQTRKQGES